MSYVFQPARYELHKQIKKYSSYIRGRVLDVGSGSQGRYKSLFKFDEYVKLDIEGVPKVDLTGTADNIPCEDNSFDSIISTQVIGDVYNLNKAFKEFYRVLKSGGTILVTEALFDSLHDQPHDYWRFTEHSLRLLAEGAGLSVEVIESRGGMWSVRAQMIIRYWINRLNVYKRWFCPMFNFLSKIYSVWYLFLDKIDKSQSNLIFTHGYIMIARKK